MLKLNEMCLKLSMFLLAMIVAISTLLWPNWVVELKAFGQYKEFTIDITSPNGNEVLIKNNDYYIKWNWSKKYYGWVRVHLYLDNQYYWTIASSIPVTEGEEGIIFNPPDNFENSDKYKIVISSLDDDIFDASDNYFTISNTQSDEFTWPIDPENETYGHYGPCGDWPKTDDGCYWVSDGTENSTTVWRDVQPFQKHEWKGLYHLGADYNLGSSDMDLNQPVYPTANGIVSNVKENQCGWGNIVFVKHDTIYGVYTSVYAHVNWLSTGMPSIGDVVTPSNPIALIGKGEWDNKNCSKKKKGSYPAHLHFEIREGDETSNGAAYTTNIVDIGPEGQIDPNKFISLY